VSADNHPLPPNDTEGLPFILPADLAKDFWQFVQMVSAAAPSGKLDAFATAARCVAAKLVHPKRFPQSEAVDRLWVAAEAAGLVALYGEDLLQQHLAEAFAGATTENQDQPHVISSQHKPEEDEGPGDDDARPPEFSDEALALRFAERHVHELKYIAAWNKWVIWSSTVWRFDETLAVLDLARRLCREIASACDDSKIARSIASRKTIAAVVNLARADRRIAATAEQWDSDPWLLNTPSGVIDLRTGKQRPHDPNDYLTKVTATSPDPSCPTPVWLKFLERVCKTDVEFISFLQRITGYALTGVTREHALFFCYGTGANGKSTFVNAVTGCIGDYHRVAPIETFTVAKNDRHPTELAALRGSRFVTSIETEEGRRWAESKIKSLTGGDKIAARFMKQDFFEFRPSFKVFIAGNHRPGLRSVDEAIRRRFHLLPFTASIAPEERDEQLGAKLELEWPGILAWMISGCLDWQHRGLDPPPVVRAATTEYLEAEDALSAWIEEAGDPAANTFELTNSLFNSWRKYAQEAGEYVGSVRKFSQRLEDRGESIGLRKGRDSAGLRGFYGLRLRTSDSQQTPDDQVPL
jgi:putative DNA primase/helicase